jgi:hypothetical protein
VSKVTDMSFMFELASKFNQSLCAWGLEMKITQPNVDSMFSGATQCQSTSNPDLNADPVSPLCYVCTIPGL